MIIYGSRATKLTTTNLFNVTCPSCKEKSTTEMYVFGKYAHVFWIPVFPLRKIGVSQCENCKAVFEDSKMNSELREEYLALKAQTKTPIWNFTGLGLIALLIIAGVYGSASDQRNYKAWIAHPEVGDKYYCRTESHNYSIEKVVAVTADSIELEYNMKEFTTSSVEEIDRPQNYEGLTEVFSRKEIERQLADETIYEVKR
jgi:hypothetical protein